MSCKSQNKNKSYFTHEDKLNEINDTLKDLGTEGEKSKNKYLEIAGNKNLVVPKNYVKPLCNGYSFYIYNLSEDS